MLCRRVQALVEQAGMLKAALKDRDERLAALAARLADMEGKMKVHRPPAWQLLCFLNLRAAWGCRRCASGGVMRTQTLHDTGDMSMGVFNGFQLAVVQTLS